MEAFTTLYGKVMPLNRVNVNTDAIIPASYLTAVSRTGFAEGLFSIWRYLGNTHQPDPDFELNMPRYQGVTVLLAGDNLGCGSSREHAPWALAEYGFRALIAPSFADIFYNNCFNVGLLPIRLEEAIVQELFAEVQAQEGYALDIDLAAQTVTTPQGRVIPFEIEGFRKEALLAGMDMIEQTLQMREQIEAYVQQRNVDSSWRFVRS